MTAYFIDVLQKLKSMQKAPSFSKYFFYPGNTLNSLSNFRFRLQSVTLCGRLDMRVGRPSNEERISKRLDVNNRVQALRMHNTFVPHA